MVRVEETQKSIDGQADGRIAKEANKAKLRKIGRNEHQGNRTYLVRSQSSISRDCTRVTPIDVYRCNRRTESELPYNSSLISEYALND